MKKKKRFPNFVLHFWKLDEVLNNLKKRMIAIADVFPKLQTVKILVRPLSKMRRFRTRFDSEHLKLSQILATSP